jgi:Fe-S-cluster containining protein
MSIALKVGEIEALYRELDAEINIFQDKSKLKCLSGCGKCCNYNEIDASPLEFLPWAFHLYLNQEAHQVLDLLATRDQTTTACYIYNPVGLLSLGQGSCSSYAQRGLICRLFGYGANTDKYGKLRLATCKLIKANQVLAFKNAEKLIAEGLNIPIFTHYYMRLSQIDFHLGNQIVPVNTALKLAIEAVLSYYAYHPPENVVKFVA